MERESQGERTVCVDEMTGIQALERTDKDLPLLLWKVQTREFEYIRQTKSQVTSRKSQVQSVGACTHLSIALFHLRLATSTCGDTRTESDEAAHIRTTIKNDPDASKWNFIVDCLNTHESESLVRLVVELEGLEIELGIKGESGMIKSMQTTAAFLSDPTHRKGFPLYTITLFLAQSN